MDSDEHQRWLHCRCDACKRLDEVAHLPLYWNELFEATKHECPNYSASFHEVPAAAPDERQIDLFEVKP